MAQAKPVIERLLPRVEFDEGGCWLWTGAKNNMGYGVIGTGGKYGVGYVHRIVYSHAVERIPAELVIDHICCTPHCVNPDHMELVTQGENIRRGWVRTRRKK